MTLNALSDYSVENLVGAKDRLSNIELTLQSEVLMRLTTKGEGYCPKLLVCSAITFIYKVERLNTEEKERFKRYMENTLF